MSEQRQQQYDTQVALITGASYGIGRGIALRLAEDGFDIAINDLENQKESLEQLARDVEALVVIVGETRRRPKCYVHVADISVEGEVKEMVDVVVKELGSLHVMVANAGVFLFKSIVDTSVEEWDHTFEVNARGVFLCYKYAAIQMITQGRGGRIIGASSVLGQQGMAGLPAYSASKFAVRGLTHSAALELAKHEITVNAYCPGTIDTPMSREASVKFHPSWEAYEADVRKNTPAGRLGLPDDVANVVSFLVSKKSNYTTGQSIGVNGGTLLG